MGNMPTRCSLANLTVIAKMKMSAAATAADDDNGAYAGARISRMRVFLWGRFSHMAFVCVFRVRARAQYNLCDEHERSYLGHAL